MNINISSIKHTIKLYLPTSFIKMKFIWKCIYKEQYKDLSIEEKNNKINETTRNIRKIYNEIKKYIKKNGHFILLEVESSEGNIKIIL